jgi:hypothetical protein
MNFKPIDEMSLRQLFSTDFSKELLRLSYIGPVLNKNTGKIDDSPDALILDMRKSPHQIKRCEFKYAPKSKGDFSHNGNFDIAVMWSIQPPLTRQQLEKELFEQNGCKELVVLDEVSIFHKLPEYTQENIGLNFNFESDAIKQMVLKNRSGIASVLVIYIAAKIYPERFDSDKMLELMVKKFASVASLPGKGRSNVVGTFIQTKLPLLKRMQGKSYQWNNDFDNVVASSLLAEWITINYRQSLPTADEIRTVIDMSYY